MSNINTSVPNKEQSMMDVLRNNIKEQLEEHYDKLAEVKLQEFKMELEKEKHLAIASILDSVYFTSTEDVINRQLDLVLHYAPKVVVRR